MNLTYRMARKAEADVVARLFLIASDGVAEYVWTQFADDYPGLSPIEIGERRFAREGVAFSYENAIVAECDGAVIGAAVSYAMEEDPDAEPMSDPVLRPVAELEYYGSLYLAGLAMFEDWRGQGLGTELLHRAAARAREMGLPRLSLIVFERNEDAHRLYLREDFHETDRRPIVPHPLIHFADGDAILMVKELN